MRKLILILILICIITSVSYAQDLIVITNLEHNKDIFREPHFTNCQDRFPDEGFEKEMFFVLTLENVDTFILDDSIIADWNVYAEKLKRRHYDKEGKYKGICVTTIPKGLPDDYDGPRQKLSDYQDAVNESYKTPGSVIKVISDDESYEDCRDDLADCKKEKKSYKKGCEEDIKSYQADLEECETIVVNKSNLLYEECDSCCPNMSMVKTWINEFIISLAVIVVLLIVFIMTVYLTFRTKKEYIEKKQEEAVSAYRTGLWDKDAEKIRRKKTGMKNES